MHTLDDSGIDFGILLPCMRLTFAQHVNNGPGLTTSAPTRDTIESRVALATREMPT